MKGNFILHLVKFVVLLQNVHHCGVTSINPLKETKTLVRKTQENKYSTLLLLILMNLNV